VRRVRVEKGHVITGNCCGEKGDKKNKKGSEYTISNGIGIPQPIETEADGSHGSRRGPKRVRFPRGEVKLLTTEAGGGSDRPD
jgi:hypothetical protein